MIESSLILTGQRVRLEPLTTAHADALATAFPAERADLYRWVDVPHDRESADRFVERTLAAAAAGSAMPFATVRLDGGAGHVVGTTRFYDIERWNPDADTGANPDVCAIGYTYLAPQTMRSGINVEAKLLMLTHAFETWRVKRVAWHADSRNERSRRAIVGLGAKLDGVLRSDKLGADGEVRDSAVYSMTLAEWPGCKEGLLKRLNR